MFSMYNTLKNHFFIYNLNYSDELGYWRIYSFGQVSVYKSDFTLVGGFDTGIKGWGKEDVNFFERVLNSTLSVFRAPDPGLIHLYHDINCDTKLPHDQYKMCLGTKWLTSGSQKKLSNIIYQLKY